MFIDNPFLMVDFHKLDKQDFLEEHSDVFEKEYDETQIEAERLEQVACEFMDFDVWG